MNSKSLVVLLVALFPGQLVWRELLWLLPLNLAIIAFLVMRWNRKSSEVHTKCYYLDENFLPLKRETTTTTAFPWLPGGSGT